MLEILSTSSTSSTPDYDYDEQCTAVQQTLSTSSPKLTGSVESTASSQKGRYVFLRYLHISFYMHYVYATHDQYVCRIFLCTYIHILAHTPHEQENLLYVHALGVDDVSFVRRQCKQSLQS